MKTTILATALAMASFPAFAATAEVTCDINGGRTVCPGLPLNTTALDAHTFSEQDLDTAFWDFDRMFAVTAGDIVLCEGAVRNDKTGCATNIAMSDVLQIRCSIRMCDALLISEQERGE